MAIAALTKVPTQGRRSAVSKLNKTIPPGSPYEPELLSRLSLAEKYERRVSSVVEKARQPASGPEALAEAARIPDLGVLGTAQAQQQVLTSWLLSRPREFADWLATSDSREIPQSARRALIPVVNQLRDDDPSVTDRDAAKELRAGLKELLNSPTQ